MKVKHFLNKLKSKDVQSKNQLDITQIFWIKCGKNNKNFGDWITSYIYFKSKGKNLRCAKKPYTVNESFLNLVKYFLCIIGFNIPNFDFNKNKSGRFFLVLGRDFLLSLIRKIKKEKFLKDTYFGSGSILKYTKGWKNVVIWGTGILDSSDTFEEPKKVLCVRGPLTRNRFLELGYKCPEKYGDNGLLLSRFYQPQLLKKYKIGIIPHYVDFEICEKLFANLHNVNIIDVCDDVENVINEICQCEMTISSSLHGIIVSHAYNIKSCWVKFSNNLEGDGVKFFDYYYSLGINEITPITKNLFSSEKRDIKSLEDLINKYPNPKFPINTDELFKTLPF